VLNDESHILFAMNYLLFFLSLLLVGFGQPAFSAPCALVAAAVGWMPIFLLLLRCENRLKKFFIATLWFAAVQLIQLSWLISHPFLYIWLVYIPLTFLAGLQFGLLALLIRKDTLQSAFGILAIASLWTLLEWVRLFFLSGFSWNPAGLALSAALYPLQFASLGGIFLLSFWVILTNLAAARLWLKKTMPPAVLWVALIAIPYLFGYLQVSRYESKLDSSEPFHALLVQTAFPIEEHVAFKSLESYVDFVMDEWRTILKLAMVHKDASVDLIALPEFVVPFGTYTPIYPYEKAKALISEILGEQALPPPKSPWVFRRQDGLQFADNAFFAQALANIFHSPLIVGLEDAEEAISHELLFFSGALFFHPQEKHHLYGPKPERYVKRVLVPMGEYIPLSFFKKIVQQYGVGASFTPGIAAAVFSTESGHLFSPSICYEETFGNITREGCDAGATMIVNLTSDIWYPNSLLPRQHFDLARLRTVENGVPLLRACNTGITCALDSLGRIQGMLSDDEGNTEWLQEALLVKVPTLSFETLYRKYGNAPIITLSLIFVSLMALSKLKMRLATWKEKQRGHREEET
jgi:apolipoprotein N-acyltransferase